MISRNLGSITDIDNIAWRGPRPYIDIMAFGADPSIANSTSVNDRAFAGALNLASANGGGTVYVPPGTYVLTNKLVIPEKTYVKGAGTNLSILRFRNTGAYSATNYGVQFTNIQTTAGLSDLTIQDADWKYNIGVYLLYSRGVRIDRVRVEDFIEGFRLESNPNLVLGGDNGACVHNTLYLTNVASPAVGRGTTNYGYRLRGTRANRNVGSNVFIFPWCTTATYNYYENNTNGSTSDNNIIVGGNLSNDGSTTMCVNIDGNQTTFIGTDVEGANQMTNISANARGVNLIGYNDGGYAQGIVDSSLNNDNFFQKFKSVPTFTGLKIGDYTSTYTATIKNHLSNTANLNFGAPVGVPGDVSLTITVTGAALGDTVTVGAPVTVPANYVLTAFVSAPNTVTVRWTQIAGAAADPDGAGGTYRVDVWKH